MASMITLAKRHRQYAERAKSKLVDISEILTS